MESLINELSFVVWVQAPKRMGTERARIKYMTVNPE